MADHWYKAASEAVARTGYPFALVDASVCLTQGDCDKMLIIPPTKVAYDLRCGAPLLVVIVRVVSEPFVRVDFDWRRDAAKWRE